MGFDVADETNCALDRNGCVVLNENGLSFSEE